MQRLAFVLLSFVITCVEVVAQPIDTLASTMLKEVVVSSGRRQEPLMRAATGILAAGSHWFRESAAANPIEALGNLRGVQFITAGLGFSILSTRGFANTTNVRMVHLVDGLDIQSPHIGAPAGYALMPTDLDMEATEVLPGMAATLFGMNAINGLISYRTRDPFSEPGLSVLQKTAINRIGTGPPSPFSETALRYAHTIGNHLAIKFNLSRMTGRDWTAGNLTDLNPKANLSTGLIGIENPGADPVSTYGNESANRRNILLGGKQYVVARTGYAEAEVTSDQVSSYRGDLSFHWRISDGVSLSYLYRMSNMNSIYQRANRFRLQDYSLHQHGVKLRTDALQVNVYMNSENTGNSYNLRSMAENLDKAYRTDNVWYGLYARAFQQAFADGYDAAYAHGISRLTADEGRYRPGTTDFKLKLSELQQINNWDAGAALKVRASFIQGDFQWIPKAGWVTRLTERTGVSFWSGGEMRTYIIRPDGNYFINPVPSREGRNLLYTKAGVFAVAERAWLGNRLTLNGVLRADRNDYFPVAWSPRLSMVYMPDHASALRASWQVGYRFPVIFEGFSNVNSGGVKRVGGLKIMSQGIFENAWLQSAISDFQRAVLLDINSGEYTKAQAIERQKLLLKKNSYSYLKPERASTVEIGYRRAKDDRTWEWEAEAYISRYEDFIGQVNMSVPTTSNPDSLGIAFYEKALQRPYRMWTNSNGRVTVAGAGFNGRKRLTPVIVVHGNIMWSKLYRRQRKDGLEDGFNTPPWAVNLSAVRYSRSQSVAATVTARWQARYFWQSFLVSGDVPAFATFDASLLLAPPKSRLTWKAGATNIFNRYYSSYLGGPEIGGFYYISATFAPRR